MDRRKEPSHDRPTDRRLMTLAPGDNVCVSCTHLPAGTALVLDGAPLLLSLAVNLGHKIARRAIAPGEKIVKFGVPIGSASAPIAAGEHVHLHNVNYYRLPPVACCYARSQVAFSRESALGRQRVQRLAG